MNPPKYLSIQGIGRVQQLLTTHRTSPFALKNKFYFFKLDWLEMEKEDNGWKSLVLCLWYEICNNFEKKKREHFDRSLNSVVYWKQRGNKKNRKILKQYIVFNKKYLFKRFVIQWNSMLFRLNCCHVSNAAFEGRSRKRSIFDGTEKLVVPVFYQRLRVGGGHFGGIFWNTTR